MKSKIFNNGMTSIHDWRPPQCIPQNAFPEIEAALAATSPAIASLDGMMST
jgi:hypothetical protein